MLSSNRNTPQRIARDSSMDTPVRATKKRGKRFKFGSTCIFALKITHEMRDALAGASDHLMISRSECLRNALHDYLQKLGLQEK